MCRKSGAEEVAQAVNLSSGSQNPCEKVWFGGTPHNPSAGEVGTGGSQGLMGLV